MNKIGYKPHGLAFKLMALMLPGVTIFSVPLAQAKAARAAKFNGKAEDTGRLGCGAHRRPAVHLALFPPIFFHSTPLST